ncbi:PGDYG domain-containing protein [Nitrogeniibacter mangrovi]|nr:PGDYG domain-containing protein [Nitrogeniibacter mangrovi]
MTIHIKRLSDGGMSADAELPPAQRAVKKPIPLEVRRMPEAFTVETLEGTMQGKAGDWLITGVDGEVYPCDADIFARTYEVVG